MMKRPLPASNPARKINRLVSSLLDWFAAHARDLPWRRTRDPYAIWVSEVMLQQTQVNTVIPYYERWIRELPDVQSLAQAGVDRLHKLWEGLGYYTRVRNMQKAARFILDNHAGRFPSRHDDMLALPGIGRYTAGAICSIAFNQPTPILDGNVIRVVARIFGVRGDPRKKTCNKRLWQLSRMLVMHAAAPGTGGRSRVNSCGELNEALMELGALVCAPREPKCHACPVASQCVARRDDRVAEFPTPVRRPRITPRHFAAFVLKRGDRIFVCQRRANAVNGLLWEFPNVELTKDADARRAALRLLGFHPSHLEALCTIRHSITRYRIQLDVYSASALNGTARRIDGRWLRPSDALQLSFPSAHRRILERIAGIRPN